MCIRDSEYLVAMREAAAAAPAPQVTNHGAGRGIYSNHEPITKGEGDGYRPAGTRPMKKHASRTVTLANVPTLATCAFG
eukprot:2308027-Pyramimonas_sp.AAC.1